jgi:2-dehydro-3-deoxy-D-arabinonate dehydratase
MRLYRTKKGAVVEDGDGARLLPGQDWDELINRRGLAAALRKAARRAKPVKFSPDRDPLLAPLGSQEVWAAGVTYYRSRDARVEESKGAGGGDFYSRVYDAPVPRSSSRPTRTACRAIARRSGSAATRSGTSPSRSSRSS